MAEQVAASKLAGSLIVICVDEPMLFEGAATRLSGRPARLVLISPVPPKEGSALGHLMATPTAQRIAGVPGPEAGEADLISYSLPGLSSLSPPAASLAALLPGLHETGRQRVTRLVPSDLAQMLSELPEPLTLWIDLPGAEAEILGVLATAGVLERVQRLELRCGVEPFFMGAEGQADIETRLKALDFTLEAVGGEDPDWPDLQFRSDPQARRLRMRDAELAEVQATLAARDSALAAAEEAAAAVQQQATTRIAELEAGLAGQRQGHEALQAEMAAAGEKIAVLEKTCQEGLVALEAEAARCRDVTARHAEVNHRCQAAREDLRRAEGQMTLLKDLLLREAGL